MKRLLLITLLLPQALCAQVKRLTAESTIETVTVFASGAQIFRTAPVSLQPGRTEIVFNELSNQLEQQSLQVKADAAITLLSVQASRDYLATRKLEQEETTLLNRSAELKSALEADMKLLDVYKAEEAMLAKNQAIGGSAGVKAAELREALDLHRQRLTEVYARQSELQKRIAALQKTAGAVAAQLVEASRKRDSSRYTVTALVESREPRAVTFQLIYTVKDAGWYPTYDVRVTDVTKPLNLLMHANIFQRSGEPWKGVALQISTGNPAGNATAPQSQPWMLGFYDPSVRWQQAAVPGTATGRVVTSRGEPVPGATVGLKNTNTATQTDANGFFKLQGFTQNSIAVVSSVGFESKEVALKPGYFTITLDAAATRLDEEVVTGYSSTGAAEFETENYKPKKQEELQTATVVTQYQPTTVVYKLDERYSIETDGKTTTIPIRRATIPALYEYYAAPKIDGAAFLTARVAGWQEYDLQSGEVALYVEGNSLGKTYLDLSEAGDTLVLSLGRDNGVSISRKTVKEFSSKSFSGANRSERRRLEITVRNTKKVPVFLIMEDQFPVSVNKEIEVDDREAPEAQVTRETGIATWRMTLQPGAEQKRQIGYAVKYPKDRRVVLQ